MTVLEQRGGLRDLLKDSPSLRREIVEVIADQITDAREIAVVSLAGHGKNPRVDPATLSFTEDQVLGSWLP